MDDLTERINQILNDPQSMQMLQNMAQNLGLNQNGNPQNGGQMPGQMPMASPPTPVQQNPSNGPDLSQLMGMLTQMGLGGQMGMGGQNQPAAPALPPIDMNAMMQVQRAMQAFTSSNKNVDLLRSLRPLLSDKRQRKVDDAIRIMQLVQMLPMLKESGLFGNGGGLI